MKKRILGVASMGAFASIMVSFWLIVRFPVEAIAQRIGEEVYAKSGGKISLELRDPSLFGLSGLEAEEVVLRAETPDGPLPVSLGSAGARLELLPLLWLQPTLQVVAEPKGSRISASLSENDGGVLGDIDIENLDIAQSMVLLSALSGGSNLALKTLPAVGKLSAKAEDFSYFPKALAKSDVRGNIALSSASVGPGILGGFSLPSVSLGSVDAEFSIQKGKVALEGFKQVGGDVIMQIDGSGELKGNWKLSPLNMCARFKGDAGFLTREPKMKTVMELAGVQLKKDKDGFLQIPLKGTFAKPRPYTGKVCGGR